MGLMPSEKGEISELLFAYKDSGLILPAKPKQQ